MLILPVSPPGGGLKRLAKIEPLDSEIIGAVVVEFHVDLLDMELDTDLADMLQRFQPDIMGASAQIVLSSSTPRFSPYWAAIMRRCAPKSSTHPKSIWKSMPPGHQRSLGRCGQRIYCKSENNQA